MTEGAVPEIKAGLVTGLWYWFKECKGISIAMVGSVKPGSIYGERKGFRSINGLQSELMRQLCSFCGSFNSLTALQFAGAPPNGCESSFHESSQFPENVSHDQHPTLYDEVYEMCLSDLCTESSYSSYASSFCNPPVSYQTPAHCSQSAVISGSPAYASMDYEYSTQHIALSPQDFCPSSHLETKSFYPNSEEYFAHQQYSCTSAICSIFSYMPDNMEMGSMSENGSFTIPEYKEYSSGLLTEDIWRGNLNECLEY